MTWGAWWKRVFAPSRTSAASSPGGLARATVLSLDLDHGEARRLAEEQLQDLHRRLVRAEAEILRRSHEEHL